MKLYRYFLLLIAVSPVLVAQVGANTATTTPPLTLADTIARATTNSPRIRQAAASEARATAASRTARAYTNPTLEVYEGRQYGRAIATPGVPGLLQHYGALQTLEIPAERRARRDAAQAAEASARAGRSGVLLSIVAEAKQAFYNSLRLRQQINTAEENLQLVQDLRRRVEAEVNVGEKGRLELTRTDAELARARFAVSSSRVQYSDAIAVLRAAIAAPAEEPLEPVGTLESSRPLPPLDLARAQVLQSHPAIAQSEAEVERSRATLRDQKALRIPQPTAFAEFENQPDLRYWRAGVNIALPIFDRRRGPIGEARAAVESDRAVLQQRRLELVRALEQAYAQYQIADEQVQSLQSGELRAAEAAVDGAKAAYRYGERGIVEVLDAQRVLQSIRGDLLDAQFARQSALVALEELGVKP